MLTIEKKELTMPFFCVNLTLSKKYVPNYMVKERKLMNREMRAEAEKIQTGSVGRGKTYDMAYIGLFVGLMAICSWISIPTAIPFTLQTFAIFLAVTILGGKRGTLAVVVYLLLGMVGVPVFAGFAAGPRVLFGTTGGYLIGFIFSALLMWLMERLPGRKLWVQMLSMLLGMVTYYIVGTIWFMVVYGSTNGPVSLLTALGWCVFPFVIPDLVKAALALGFGSALKKPLAEIMETRGKR